MFEFDLADRVDDLICTFEGGSESDMDWVSMIVTGWIVFMLSSFIGVKFLYRKLRGLPSLDQPEPVRSDPAPKAEFQADNNGALPSNGVAEPGPKVVSENRPRVVLSPNGTKCTGPDPDVVDYVTECHDWFSGQLKDGRELEELKDGFVDALNKILRGTRKEDSVCLTVVDVFQAEDLTLVNLFAEQHQTDIIKSTCDCETSLRGILSVFSADQGSRTCDIFVDRLSGRLKLLLNLKTLTGTVRFDGWPEICLGIIPIKDTSRLDPKLAELVTEKLSGAIREAEVEIDFKQFSNFPQPPPFTDYSQHPARGPIYGNSSSRREPGDGVSNASQPVTRPSRRNKSGQNPDHYYDSHNEPGYRNPEILVTQRTSPTMYNVKGTSKSPTPDSSVTGMDGQYGDERGRRRTRRGEIFTSIRRRFSKTRSKSAMPNNEFGGDESQDPRSISADRRIFVKETGLGLGLGSARSSDSSLSGFSGHSTSTFFHESSTLVIESIENRIKKYFLVPPSLAENGKWKKRGKKLHIYNDHTFVAKRIASGTPCSVCFGRFQFSLGKQGYQCRDCRLKCHKECHIRVPSYCGNTSVYDIDLEHMDIE